ncbi:hypothetical protein [Demequina sp. NBRC 110054]|uniref:hypothetical protein n=1 Tax=Demequina sp. NBRC 110054 TaxID=1570343 RepID=UPI0009FBEA3E|nr:hypothetical protein [Demequina sp. NBRC 110054]
MSHLQHTTPRRPTTTARWLATLALTLLLLAFVPSPALADDAGLTGGTEAAQEAGLPADADLVLFWGDGCPHCAAEKEWLAEYQAAHPEIVVQKYEVWYDADNQALMIDTAAAYGIEITGVPLTIIGDETWAGWSDPMEDTLAAALAPALDDGGALVDDPDASASGDNVIDVPLAGEVDLDEQSLLVSTLIIGFVDGVNPCSLWVISVLLAIVLRTGSRRRVIAIGSTFLAVTALMYALYMAAFYSVLTVVGWMGWIQVLVALVAGIFGIVSVKDYFAFKQGLSFTISDSAKPGIYKRMRAAASHEALLPALGATIVLAVGVSLLETPCTAGFPLLWTGLLQANDVGPIETVGLFVAYMIPFLLDELAVFAIAIVTMRATKFQDRHGELLKLFAGVTMLVLAAVMLLDPTLMNSPWVALGLFAGAFVLAAAIHLVTLRIRAPRD